jgi:iron complex transport system substrate-binding protein
MRSLLFTAAVIALNASTLDGPSYFGPRPPEQIQRVITLAPSLTETVIALRAGDRLVGVSRFDQLPEVSKLPRVGGFLDPSVEAVIRLKPDLVLVQPSPGNQKPVEKMAELGMPVLALPMHRFSEVLDSIREIGNALGLRSQADGIVSRIERTRHEVRQRARRLKPVRALLIYGFEPLVVAGPGSFGDELLKDAGGINAAGKATAPYQVYSAESALRSHPDVVLNATHDPAGAEKYARLPGLQQARWVKLPSDDLLHPGPKLGRGLEELFQLLHPENEPGPLAR